MEECSNRNKSKKDEICELHKMYERVKDINLNPKEFNEIDDIFIVNRCYTSKVSLLNTYDSLNGICQDK